MPVCWRFSGPTDASSPEIAPFMKLCARYAAIPNCIRGYTMPLALLRYGLSGRLNVERCSVPLVGPSYSRFEVDTRAPADRTQFGDVKKFARGSIRL